MQLFQMKYAKPEFLLRLIHRNDAAFLQQRVPKAYRDIRNDHLAT